MKCSTECLNKIFIFLTGFYFLGVSGYVTEPEIEDLSNGHTQIGEDIVLKCTVDSNKQQVLVQWNSPLNLNLTSDRVNQNTTTQTINSTYHRTRSFYRIKKATQEDQSTYYCTVTDAENTFDLKYSYMWVPVYKSNDSVIKFYKERTIFDKANSEIQVFVKVHPNATFQWLDKNNKTIEPNSSKFEFSVLPSNRYTNYKSILKFKNIFLEDFGNYTVVAKNEFERKELVFPFNITGPPAVSLSVTSSDEKNTTIKCQTTAYPKPAIRWYFEPCLNISCFSSGNKVSKNVNNFKINAIQSEEYGLQVTSFVSINSTEMGVIRGIASNSLGEASAVQYIYNVSNNFEVYAPNLTSSQNSLEIEALFHETVEIICAVSLQDYNREIRWYRKGRQLALDDIKVPIKGFDEYKIESIDAIYSSISKMSVVIDKTDSDVYTCKASTKDGRSEDRKIKIEAREKPTLNVASNMHNNTVEVKLGYPYKFDCHVDGYPTPSIHWFKENATIKPSDNIQFQDENQILAINYVGANDNGTYKCVVTNRLNNPVIQTATLKTKENEFDWLLVIIILLIIVLVVVSIFTFIKLRKEHKLKKELEEAGLANFEKGAIEYLNPELRLDDQADLLPYDQKWEIPGDKLILGKELGSGAFGVVLKGNLQGFFGEDVNTPVAVKTVHKLAGFDSIKALASELKIMAHLGKHVNIVNLIGACTKDIAKRKLLVVVEFCPFGSLHEYILQYSRSFIDQRNNEKSAFDWAVGQQGDSSKVNYTTITFSRTDSVEDPEVRIEPKQGTNNYYEEKRNYICSKDFLEWAFQIAKGMEYLASRRVLHGDLAARNVLLSDDNVVKISDFGLSRNMYKNGIYKKKENGPLPVKWMAVESIGENIFSTQSDIWSFGVVLWEFFSLAKTPYPGMEINQTFYKQLFEGYRMEIPEYATNELYQIMLHCWNADPMLRPSFAELAEKIGLMLEASVKNHYLDMNKSYVQMNKQEEDNEDYLLMMTPPTFDNIVPTTKQTSPHYVNNINYFNLMNNPRYVTFPKTENE